MAWCFSMKSTRSQDASAGNGPDVSREGVQRDILPIVEGTTVNTRYGMVRTDHILFIAAGAFHVSKPSDLIPELQGPLSHPGGAAIADRGSLFHPYPQGTEERAGKAIHGATRNGRHQAQFHRRCARNIARFATMVNEHTENIGARRLHTIMEKLLDEISFEAPDMKNKP